MLETQHLLYAFTLRIFGCKKTKESSESTLKQLSLLESEMATMGFLFQKSFNTFIANLKISLYQSIRIVLNLPLSISDAQVGLINL